MNASLDYCWTKIDRANENIESLDVEANAFIDSGLYEFVLDGYVHNRTKKYAQWGVASVKDVSPRFSVLAGEIIHHLRSSLDLLVFQLVRRNTGADPINAAVSEFPVLTKNPGAKGTKTYEKVFGTKVKGVSSTAETQLESMQPYHLQEPTESLLYVVHDLNRIDKHRLLLAMISVLDIVEQPEWPPSLIRAIGSTPYALRPGAKLYGFCAVGDVEPNVKDDFVADITFVEKGAVQGKPVIPALRELSKFVSDSVNSFSREF